MGAPRFASVDGPSNLDSWTSGGERLFALPHGGHDGVAPPLLLDAKIEYPPFDDLLRFTVARTGSCLNVREGPSLESAIRGCLADGTHVSLAVGSRRSGPPGLSRELDASVANGWLYVSDSKGTEGWASSQFVDWA